MYLVRLIYCSRFSDSINVKQLMSIVEVSRDKNPKKDITGVLCYSPGLFLQCLEGPRGAVNDLYRKIVQDDRNKDVTLLEFDDIAERVFGAWSMAYIRAEDISAGPAGLFGPEGRFDPFRLTADTALAFVRALVHEKERLH